MQSWGEILDDKYNLMKTEVMFFPFSSASVLGTDRQVVN